MGKGYGIPRFARRGGHRGWPEAAAHPALDWFLQRAEALRAAFDAGHTVTPADLAAVASDHAAAVRACAVAERLASARSEVEAATKRLLGARGRARRSQGVR